MSLWGLHHSGLRFSGGHVTVRSCHSGQQVSGGHDTMGAMSQWAAGQWWPCQYGGLVTVGSRSVVATSLWGPRHSGQQVSCGHVTMGATSQWAAVQWWSCHCEVMSQWVADCCGHVTVRNRPLVAHVTVGSRSVVAMSLWGPCHSEQQVSVGHVTVGAMSQWAAGQWWPRHCEVMSQ